MSWLNTPMNQLAWWQLGIVIVGWFGVAVVIYFFLLGLEAWWRKGRRRRRR